MKKIDDVIRTLDAQVDRHGAPVKIFLKKYFTMFSSTMLLALAVIFIFRLANNKPYFLASVMSEDLQKMAKILKKIDKHCNILNISCQHCQIDFLTVEKFTGSEIGCLNLAYPDKWKGPYFSTNPRIQQKHYELVNIDEGLFIVPGNGVQLPNGYVMGKDVVISRTTPIKKLIAQDGLLNYKGQALAYHLVFKIGDWDSSRTTPEELDRVNSLFKEFNEAMSFTMSEYHDNLTEPFCV